MGRYRRHGRTIRQSTETTDARAARAFLDRQVAKVALKIPINIEADRLTLADGAAMIRQDYQQNARKLSERDLQDAGQKLTALDPMSKVSAPSGKVVPLRA